MPELRDEVESFVDGPALRMSVLTHPTVWCDPERGLRIVPGVHTSEGRQRLRRKLRPFNRVVEWARERYLHSAWVIELLFLTVASWQHVARKVRFLEIELAAMVGLESFEDSVLAYRRQEIAGLTRAAEGWGPWVDVLCGEASVELRPVKRGPQGGW